MKVEDEDYWNTSDTTGFSFDDESISASSLFESSKSVASNKRPDRFADTSNIFNEFAKPQAGSKPIEALVSKKSLATSEEPHSKVSKTPEEEISLLKKQLGTQSEAPSAAYTIRAIFLAKPYSLHLYRSLESKSQLLGEAVKSHDGNVILCVVLFLSKTLNNKLFVRLMQSNSIAVAVYINYLSIRFQFKTAVDLLLTLGRSRDAALKEFQFLIKRGQNLDRRLSNLKILQRDHYSSPDVDDKQFVDNFLKYVEWQVAAGRTTELSGTVAASLSHLCQDHWQDVRDKPLSPLALTSLLAVSDRLFHWKAITARASVAAWDDISNLLLAKSWLGGKKLKTVISAERIVIELHRQRAPETVISEYFALVESADKQLDLARKLAWYRAAIDTYVNMRDRQGLMQYKAALNPQSNDYFHAETALRNPGTKWKN